MRNTSKVSYRKVCFIVGGIAAVIILCGAVAIMLLNHPVQLRSDSAGIEFVTEAGQVTCIAVRGKFPYVQVNCPVENDYVQDPAGNVTEKICTYTMQAEPAFFGQSMTTMKLNIETSSEMTYTYILKFVDKDVKIVNGKVVE